MTRIFLVRKSTPYFAVIFNVLTIISRFCDKSQEKKGGGGKNAQFCWILNLCNLSLLKAATSLNNEKTTTKVQFTIHCRHRYLLKNVRIGHKGLRIFNQQLQEPSKTIHLFVELLCQPRMVTLLSIQRSC